MANPFPPCPIPTATRWVSVDPAGGKKPTLAVAWQGGNATEIVEAHRETRVADLAPVFAGAEVVVIESGHGRSNMATAMLLAHARGVIEGAAHCAGAVVVYVSPEHWRGVLGLPKRAPRGETKAHLHRAEKALCERLAGVRPLFAQATNEDTRAALLIGEACAVRWGWTRPVAAYLAAPPRKRERLPTVPRKPKPVKLPKVGQVVQFGASSRWHRVAGTFGKAYHVECDTVLRQDMGWQDKPPKGAEMCARCEG